MEGEAVAIALLVAAVVALVIVKLGSRQPAEYRPLSTSEAEDDASTKPADSAATARRQRRLTPRLPRQRQGSPTESREATRRRLAAAREAARTPIDADLLRTLEELAAHPQNRAAAVNLLRQRTGMSLRHARKFINAL